MVTEYKIGEVIKIRRGDKRGTATVKGFADGKLRLEMSPGLLQFPKVMRFSSITNASALPAADRAAYHAGAAWALRLCGLSTKEGRVIVRGIAS